MKSVGNAGKALGSGLVFWEAVCSEMVELCRIVTTVVGLHLSDKFYVNII
jgi:hypothetical protein